MMSSFVSGLVHLNLSYHLQNIFLGGLSYPHFCWHTFSNDFLNLRIKCSKICNDNSNLFLASYTSLYLASGRSR